MSLTVSFGNLTTEQMVKRLGINLTEEEIQTLEERRIDSAQDTPKGGWHCFYAPFKVVTGDDEMAQLFVDIIMPHNSEIKEQMMLESYGK